MNSLTTVSWMATQSPQKIPHFIDNLSAILHSHLQPSTGQFWGVAEEIRLTRSLLELASVRFGDRLHFSCEVTHEASHCMVPQMLVEPLVENAIKYTPLNLPDAKIAVVAEIHSGRLVVTVTNPIKEGTTESVSASLKIGHANIRQRLAILYENAGRFEFEATRNLVTARLVLPVVPSTSTAVEAHPVFPASGYDAAK